MSKSTSKPNYLAFCQGKPVIIQPKEQELKVVGFETTMSPKKKPKYNRFTTSYLIFSKAGIKGSL